MAYKTEKTNNPMKPHHILAGRVPDILWLHNSGILMNGFTEAGKTELSAFTLELPHAAK